MSHLVSLLVIRRTQVIPELGVDYNVRGDFTWRFSDSVKN